MPCTTHVHVVLKLVYTSFTAELDGLQTHLDNEVWAVLGQLLQLSGPLLHVLCCLLNLRCADLRTFST